LLNIRTSDKYPVLSCFPFGKWQVTVARWRQTAETSWSRIPVLGYRGQKHTLKDSDCTGSGKRRGKGKRFWEGSGKGNGSMPSRACRGNATAGCARKRRE